MTRPKAMALKVGDSILVKRADGSGWEAAAVSKEPYEVGGVAVIPVKVGGDHREVRQDDAI